LAQRGDASPKDSQRIFQELGEAVKARFGDFVLDSQTRQLTRGEQEIHLSPKAFAVLCALLEKRPNVVAKADLFGQIWPDVFVVEGNLNVLVGEIRRALGDDPQEQRFIRTVHGVGYAFSGRAVDVHSDPASGSERERFWLTWKSQTFALADGDTIIGRDPRCQVWLDHSGVSRRHAKIRIGEESDRPMLIDLGSTNGTFVRGERVEVPTPLADGDVIKVGSVSVKFREWTDGSSRTKRIRGASRASR
jgi:DNA-binding winged helix-turn-helix (wHTH) protein